MLCSQRHLSSFNNSSSHAQPKLNRRHAGAHARGGDSTESLLSLTMAGAMEIPALKQIAVPIKGVILLMIRAPQAMMEYVDCTQLGQHIINNNNNLYFIFSTYNFTEIHTPHKPKRLVRRAATEL